MLKSLSTMLLLCLFMFDATASSAATCTIKRDKHGNIYRSVSAVKHFRATNACPSTHQFGGRCTGYVVDHVRPLCDCGVDLPVNMQWQTLAASKVKDRWEKQICRGKGDS